MGTRIYPLIQLRIDLKPNITFPARQMWLLARRIMSLFGYVILFDLILLLSNLRKPIVSTVKRVTFATCASAAASTHAIV